MTIKHTPEPWKLLPEECDKPYIRIRGTVWGVRYKIANVLTPTHAREADETRANARRIVACVNAMAGIEDNNTIFDEGNSVRSVISTMAGKNADLERQLAEMRAAAHNLEVAANTAAYCYEKRPENFASALAKLQETAEAVRGLTVETPNALTDHCYVAGGK